MAQHDRRNILRAAGGTLAAGGLAASITACTTQPLTQGTQRAPTFVFVHGTNASAAFWTPYTRELQFRGYRTIAIDQPYHGPSAYIPKAYPRQDLAALATETTPLGELGLDDYAEHVENAVRRAATDGPVILVGHSLGGASLSRVGNSVPELVSHICYMAAYCCSHDLPTVDECNLTPESHDAIRPAGLVVGDPGKLGVFRYNFLGADDDDLAMLKKMAWGDNSDASFLASLLSMQPDEPARLSSDRAVGESDHWGRIPRTYIRFADDHLITAELQDRMIADADALTPDNRFHVHNVKAPHFGPEDVGEIVDILANMTRAD